jgi:hypothetical protein
MKLYKVRIEKSDGGLWVVIKKPQYVGSGAKISAVYYSNSNLNEVLRLRDADGDEFMTPLHGQPLDNKGVYIFDSPIPVKLPLSCFDEDAFGGNKIIIWGELFDLE